MEKLICPKCQHEMDFMAFIKSPTPWHLKCVYCKTKVRLQKYELKAFLIAMSIGVIALSGLAYYNASSLLYAAVLTTIVAGYEYLLFITVRKLGVGLEER